MAKQNLSFREKLGFGLGDTASNIVYQAVMNILLFVLPREACWPR